MSDADEEPLLEGQMVVNGPNLLPLKNTEDDDE